MTGRLSTAMPSQRSYLLVADSELIRDVSFDIRGWAAVGVVAPSTISLFLIGLLYNALLPESSGFSVLPSRSKPAKAPLARAKKRIFALGSPWADFPFPHAAEAFEPIVNRSDSSFERRSLSSDRITMSIVSPPI